MESAAKVEEIWGEVKYILPVLITFIAGAGAYYVRTQSENLQRTIKDELKAQIENQNELFDKRFKEIDEKLTASYQAADAKMNFQGAGVRYKLALNAWEAKNFRDAIYHADMALEHADYAIRLFESLNERKTGEAKDLSHDLEYRCHIVGDLAYYYADAYKTNPQISDGARAVDLARRLRDEWRVFEEPPITLVDTYLYVLAAIRAIPQEEREAGRTIWEKYHAPLMEFLEDYNPTTAKEHFELFKEFFGPV